MTLRKRIEGGAAVYTDSLSRKCSICGQYIHPHEKFIIEGDPDDVLLRKVSHSDCYLAAKAGKEVNKQRKTFDR